jgi:hypothetical protein
MNEGTIYVDCPCCKARLEVRRDDGKIIQHWDKPVPKAKPGMDLLKEATEKLKADKEKRDRFLDDAKSQLEGEKRRLQERFEREKKRVEEEGDKSPPPRPFDFD